MNFISDEGSIPSGPAIGSGESKAKATAIAGATTSTLVDYWPVVQW